jgi:esterase/lipase
MAKTIFIIPGFKEQVTDTRYQWLISYLESKKFTVYGVPITWNNKTVTHNAKEFLRFFEEHKSSNNYVLGFSYGAVIALMTARTVQPKKLVLCSLSPDFKEDLQSIPPVLKQYIGARRLTDISTRSGVALAKSLEADTVILCGKKEGSEYPHLLKRCEDTARLAKNAKLIIVKDAPHDISFPTYQAAIKKVI